MNLSSLWKRLSPGRIDTIIMVVGCLYPLVPLLDLHFNFAYDWTVHLYNIAYFGEYFRQHFSFPSVINTQPLIGWALPIYYGFTFYSLCGFFSSFLGAAFAYRLFVIVMSFIQYGLVRKVVTTHGGSRLLSNGIALFVAWSIYPLTNLYNRSATTEYAAVLALQCGFCCWILLAQEPNRWKKTLLPWAFGFFFALSAGSHPITAFYGAFTFLIYWLFTFYSSKEKKYLLGVTFVSGTLAFLILSPWIYAVIKFRRFLQISSYVTKIWMSPAIDGFWTRLSLFPYDPRPPWDSTPHLDAQMNMPLFFISMMSLFLILVRLTRKPRVDQKTSGFSTLAVVSGFLFVIFFVLSTWEYIWSLIPYQYHIIQQAYRLVTYINLTLFFLAVALISKLIPTEKKQRSVVLIVSICLAISVTATGIKLWRARNVPQWPNKQGLVSRNPPALLSDIPFGVQNMARNAYVTNGLFLHAFGDPRQWQSAPIPISPTESEFGMTQPLEMNVSVPGWVVTNVQSFPWNTLVVDEKPLEKSQIIDSNNVIAINMAAGPHEIKYEFKPEPLWNFLRILSNILFFGWFFCLLGRGGLMWFTHE